MLCLSCCPSAPVPLPKVEDGKRRIYAISWYRGSFKLLQFLWSPEPHPSPPVWSLSYWHCKPSLCLCNFWSSLFPWIWSEPMSPHLHGVDLPHSGSAGAIDPDRLGNLPTAFSHVYDDLLHRGPLATSSAVFNKHEPRKSNLRIYCLSVLWSAPACKVAFISVLSNVSIPLKGTGSVLFFFLSAESNSALGV